MSLWNDLTINLWKRKSSTLKNKPQEFQETVPAFIKLQSLRRLCLTSWYLTMFIVQAQRPAAAVDLVRTRSGWKSDFFRYSCFTTVRHDSGMCSLSYVTRACRKSSTWWTQTKRGFTNTRSDTLQQNKLRRCYKTCSEGTRFSFSIGL